MFTFGSDIPRVWLMGLGEAVLLCRPLAAPLRSGRRQVARCVNECWQRQSEAAAFWGRVVPEVPGGESRYARERKVIRV